MSSPRILMILLLSILFDLLARAVERRTLVWQTAGRRGPSAATATTHHPNAGARAGLIRGAYP